MGVSFDGIRASELVRVLTEAMADGSDPFVVVGPVEATLLADVVEVSSDAVAGEPAVVLLFRSADLDRDGPNVTGP